MSCPCSPTLEKLLLCRLVQQHQCKVIHHSLDKDCHISDSEGRHLYTHSSQTNHHAQLQCKIPNIRLKCHNYVQFCQALPPFLWLSQPHRAWQELIWFKAKPATKFQNPTNPFPSATTGTIVADYNIIIEKRNKRIKQYTLTC